MANLDVREASYRATYWKQPPSETAGSFGRLTPVGNVTRAKEQARGDVFNKSASFKAYSSRAGSPTLGRLHEARLNSAMSEAGGLRSLPTQIRDRPAGINVNHLRGGQRSYTAKANIDNYIEERTDKNYLSGKAALFERTTYDSVATTTLREAQSVYLQKQQRRMMCKLPDVGGKDFRSRTWTRTSLVNYGDQAGDAAGKYWVGTAPCNMYKSVSHTVHGEGAKPEFQARSLGSDGRSRMLSSMKPEHKPDAAVLAAYKQQWGGAASARAERSWKSEHVDRYTSWVDIAPTLDTRLKAKEGTVTDLRQMGVQGSGAFN